ncbi:T9SS type B sorting domain-containing protein [Empedobacter tilapiae]
MIKYHIYQLLNHKLYFATLLGLGSVVLYGQQKICQGTTKTYKVDELENSGNGTVGSTYVWKVLESNFSGNYTSLTTSGNQVEIDWQNTPSGGYTLQVTEKNSCGSSMQKLQVTITEATQIDLAPIHYFCPDFNSMTIIAPSGFDEYNWFDEHNNLVYTSTSSTFVVNKAGKYRLEAKIGSCVSIAETEVQLIEFPSILVNTDLDNSMIIVASGGNTSVQYQLEDEKGKIIYPWQDSNTFKNVVAGKYIIRVKSKNGECLTEIPAEAMVITNVITPNNDGINDNWDLSKLLNAYPNALVEIYDRFGKKVKVITKSENFIWDGKIAGKPVSTDNYWYVIKLNDKQTKSGSILIKNR